MMKVCQKCNEKNPDNADICFNCHTNISQPDKGFDAGSFMKPPVPPPPRKTEATPSSEPDWIKYDRTKEANEYKTDAMNHTKPKATKKSQTKNKPKYGTAFQKRIIPSPSVQDILIPSIVDDSNLRPLRTAVSGLGSFGTTIVEIAAYRLESKKLNIEKERIGKQGEIITDAINAQVKIKLAEIDNRKQVIMEFINQIKVSSVDRKYTRQALTTALDNAGKSMSRLAEKKELPSNDIFEVYRKVISEISKQLVDFNDQGVNQTKMITQTVSEMISNVRHELELPSYNRVLNLPEK